MTAVDQPLMPMSNLEPWLVLAGMIELVSCGRILTRQGGKKPANLAA